MQHSRPFDMPGKPPTSGGAALALPLPPIQDATNIDLHLDSDKKLVSRRQPKCRLSGTGPPNDPLLSTCAHQQSRSFLPST